MAFKLVEKKWGISGLPDDEVSVSKTSISFGDNFKKMLTRNNFVEVYCDKEELKVGFRVTDNSETGYKIQHDKLASKRPSVTSSKVTTMVPVGRYKAHMEGQLIVIKVARLLGLNKVEDNQPLSEIVPDLETFD
jgi:hypothetical protein